MARNDNSEKYAYLDQFSTEALEELLRTDIASPDDKQDEAVFHILEVLKRREREESKEATFDVERAWSDFQTYYNTPEGEGLSLFEEDAESEEDDEAELHIDARNEVSAVPGGTIRPKRWLKRILVAAATIVVFLMGMVGVQASGIDVFGAFGRWTAETFKFVIPTAEQASGNDNATPNPEHEAYYNALQTALVECGISGDLAPTWYPEGFEAAEPEVISDEFGDTINCVFTNAENVVFTIDLTRYNSASDISAKTFEKDDQSTEKYTSGDRTFYVLSNIENTTATWSDGTSLVMTFSGDISGDNLKSMIDSMGGTSE